MAALWRSGPLPFTSLIEEVRSTQAWGDATIKTLLTRLIHKGAVRSVKEDGRQRYHAEVTHQQHVEGEIQALADRLFDGDLAQLRAWLSAEAKASD